MFSLFAATFHAVHSKFYSYTQLYSQKWIKDKWSERPSFCPPQPQQMPPPMIPTLMPIPEYHFQPSAGGRQQSDPLSHPRQRGSCVCY